LARDTLKFEILLILFAVRFTTFWHRHHIMTHFWPPAVCSSRTGTVDNSDICGYGIKIFITC